MDKIKVEKIVDIFCDNINILNNRYRNIIKELIINIIEKHNNLPHAQILYNLRENIKEQYKKNKNVAR